MAGPDKTHDSALGIIAGGGALPLTVAQSAREAGRAVHIVGVRGAAEEAIEAFPHTWVKLGELGRMLKALNDAACRQLIIAGGVRRPDLANIRLDLGAIANLPAILSLTVGGDNTVLTSVVGFFESKGFEVVGADEIAPGLLAGPGPLGARRPGKRDRADIGIGLRVVASLGALDVGQAAVVAGAYVLAVEAAEGTDRMLARCGELRPWGRSRSRRHSGVLVKCAKPGQDRRVDLPAIGPDTVNAAHAAGLSGIAVAASDVLVIERERLVETADRAGLFVIGVEPEQGA